MLINDGRLKEHGVARKFLLFSLLLREKEGKTEPHGEPDNSFSLCPRDTETGMSGSPGRL